MTTPDQPAPGSTISRCSNGGAHHKATHMRGGALVHVQRCTLCGWIDFAGLDAQVRELVAEGRRQATEGWDREWGFTELGGAVDACDGEAEARRFATYRKGRTVVSRLVGPWEAAEQAQPSRWDGARMRVVHIPLLPDPGEQVCVHCEERIIFSGSMWIHLSNLSACDNGRTNAQPRNGSRWTPPAAERAGGDRG